MSNVFLFPGQSSKSAKMFAWLERIRPTLFAEVTATARDVLGELPLPTESDVTPFPDNFTVQVCVFLANHLHLRVLADMGIDARYSAGLSLGEYNHLVHIGAFSFEDALQLVAARGRAYDQGPQGTMAAIFPIEFEELAPIVDEVGHEHCVAIANYNSPTQFVVAGTAEGVAAVVRRVEEETYANARVIEKQVPMHCEHFRPAASLLRPHLEAVRVRPCEGPYIPNVEPEFVARPSKKLVVVRLERHVYQPVRFRQTIDMLLEAIPDATFIEVGPRHVLTDLLNKRWCKRPKFSTHDEAALEQLDPQLRSQTNE